MRRYQYRLNDQNASLGPWAVMQPLKYIETVPGETYGGTISVKATTGLIDKVIHSRAYYDLYAFYCPIRLLWPDFPTHLAAGKTQPIEPPQTYNLWPENFEGSYVGDDGAISQEGTGRNAAFLRRMYYMCGYQFFAPESTSANRDKEQIKQKLIAGDYDQQTAFIAASARASTFESSWQSQGFHDEEITLNNERLSIKELRAAYADDRFEKMRTYYGGRYVDVLRGYGVKADWGILTEPECIGVSNNDFRFVQRNSTGDTNFGQRNGYFEGEYKLKLRKTFSPEHGIIGIYAVARGDVFNSTSGANIIASRNFGSNAAWYDPIRWQSYNEQQFPQSLIDSGATRGKTGYSPLGEHLRKGRNEIAVPAGTDLDKIPIFARSMTEFLGDDKKWGHALCNPDTTADVREAGPQVGVTSAMDEELMPLIDPAPAEISHYTEVRVAKRSPVQPAPVTSRR